MRGTASLHSTPSNLGYLAAISRLGCRDYTGMRVVRLPMWLIHRLIGRDVAACEGAFRGACHDFQFKASEACAAPENTHLKRSPVSRILTKPSPAAQRSAA